MRAFRPIHFWLTTCLITLGSRPTLAQTAGDLADYDIPPNAIKRGPYTDKYYATYFEYYEREAGDHLGARIGTEIYDGPTKLKCILYKDGDLHGVQREWYPDGQLKSESPYREGCRDGEFHRWDEKGRLTAKYQINNGTGVERIYNSSGLLLSEQPYVKNKPEGLHLFRSEDGKLVHVFHQTYGDLDGWCASYYLSGNLARLQFMQTNLCGPSIEWNEKGQVTNSTWYRFGDPVGYADYVRYTTTRRDLPPPLEDLNAYKTLLPPEYQQRAQEFIRRPNVKIPLEFNAAGEPVPRKR